MTVLDSLLSIHLSLYSLATRRVVLRIYVQNDPQSVPDSLLKVWFLMSKAPDRQTYYGCDIGHSGAIR